MNIKNNNIKEAIQLHCQWLQQPHRKYLIERIKSNNNFAIISEQILATQHFKVWLQQTKPIQSLTQHPLLTQTDHRQIQSILQQRKKDQIKYGFYGMFGCMAIYLLGLKRTAAMRRLFNRKDSTFRNYIFKGLACYTIFLASITSFTSYFQKKISQDIKQKKLFQKYGIRFEQKNV